MFEAPENETIFVVYMQEGNPTHVITSTKFRDVYYLYKVQKGKLVKTKYSAKDPTDLEKYVWNDKKS